MDNREKLRMEALKRLADQNLDPEEYVNRLKEMKADRARALLHREESPAARDFDENFSKKIDDTEDRLDELNDEGKTEEQLEREAYDRLYDERLKRGMLTRPFKSFMK